MNKIILSSIVILSSLTTLNANEKIDDFESLLSEASKVITKKSINVDYLPSVVTVIAAQTFVDAGIQNVKEALSMMPGIQMQINYLGQPITNVRGFKNPNSVISDKIKILVDGVAINNEASGTSGFYLDFPIKLVDRIELLRGPGSTVYGAGAFYGAINIITKSGSQKDENQLYVGIGNYSYTTAGANLSTKVGNWKIYTDAYYEKNEKAISDQGQTTDEAMKNLSIGVKVSNGGFDFLTRYKRSHYGNFFIYKGDVEPNQDRGNETSYFFSQISYKSFIGDFKLNTKINFSNRESDISAYLYNSVEGIAFLFKQVDVTLNDAFYVKEAQSEQNIGVESVITFPKILSNDINLVLGARKTSMSKNNFFSSIENSIAQNLNSILAHPNYNDFRFRQKNEPAYWKDPTSTKIFNKTDRTIGYLSIQDLISINENTDLILGARVDNYSDIGIKYSSRAGLVYRANDKLILKLLYGSAFRAPSFTEAYAKGHIYYRAGDENIKPEETKTYESALIYKPDFNNKFSVNVFYSQLSHVIDLEELEVTYPGYQNMKNRESKGLEFEYFFRTKKEHNLYLNASYVEADYTLPRDSSTAEIDQSMPDISKLMIKAMYIYSPLSKLSFGTIFRYYSQTTSTQLPWIINNKNKVPTVNQQYIMDETITYRLSNSSDFRLTIKNIFNEEVRNPSYYYQVNGGDLREGRNYFLNYTHTF